MMRRSSIHLSVLVAALLLASGGCTSMLMFGHDKPEKTLEDLTANPTTRLVSKYTHPDGMNYRKVEAVSLVMQLDGTGEDPPPTPQRATVVAEMQRHQIENPQEILASLNTAIVLMKAYIPPGVQEGDRIDVEVRTPTRSETTSLRGGWVLPARMTELAALGGQIREGHVMAVVEGAILVDPSATGEDDVAIATRGRILSGGVVTKSRPLGLAIGQEHRSFRLSTQLAQDINHRFYGNIDGRRQGVANPKTDDYIEIKVHPRYKDNITRYMRVVRSIAVGETTAALQERLAVLGPQLLDPLTTSSAAIQLEAIGDASAVKLLEQGLKSPLAEVRLYSAEALAYLDKTIAVEPLKQLATDEPAFRVNALSALSAMNDVMAFDALRTMLSVESAETRYGAFRALWAMDKRNPMVAGEQLASAFSYHVLDVEGPPMIHITNSHRPEVVQFGTGQSLKLPLLIEAGPRILLNGMNGDRITVSRFMTSGETLQREVSPSIDEVVRAIVEVGGKYPDVVQFLQQAKQQGALESRFRIDALPQTGRKFQRPGSDDEPPAEDEPRPLLTPLPDLFKKT